LTFDHIQRREDHWAIVDLVGKAAHVRAVPMPDWVKETLDHWLNAADIRQGKLFRCVCRKGTVWGTEVTENVRRSGRLTLLIPSFGYADKQNAAEAVGEHTDVQKELAPASIIVLVRGALVFQL